MRFDFTIVLVGILVFLMVVIYFLVKSKGRTDLIDLFEGISIVEKNLNNRFPERRHGNPSLQKAHGEPFFEKYFLIQFDDVFKTFMLNRKTRKVELMRTGDLRTVKRDLLQDELLTSTFGKEVKGEQIKAVFKDMVEGTTTS